MNPGRPQHGPSPHPAPWAKHLSQHCCRCLRDQAAWLHLPRERAPVPASCEVIRQASHVFLQEPEAASPSRYYKACPPPLPPVTPSVPSTTSGWLRKTHGVFHPRDVRTRDSQANPGLVCPVFGHPHNPGARSLPSLRGSRGRGD